MPQPESPETPTSGDKKASHNKSSDEKSSDKKFWDEKSSSPVVAACSAREVTDVFRTLAAHGGGAASFDLALDLVLNEVVQQARLLTGATGAAIALARNGEMVCRATTGGDAPELGVRFEMTSGLSGACLQTGTIQQCGDTETDPRVNAAACRNLGVRSILVLPLSEGKDPFGILEVFSSRPSAFSDRDVNPLQVLARRVVENTRGAEEVAAVLPSAGDKSDAHTNEGKPSPDYDQLWSDGGSFLEQGSSKRSEVWTTVLGVLVIVVAVLLGLALGWRGVPGRGLRGGGQKRTNASPVTRGDGRTHSTGEVNREARSGTTSQPRMSRAAGSVEPPSAGLLVTQNGKVIYRLPPEEPRAATGTSGTTEASENVSATRLIHRVDPQYPPDASARHIQGLVALDIQIGADGAVHNIAVVEGDPVLAGAAVQAVRQWRYQPYSVDGRPVEMQTRITIRFTLPPS
jgi:TonB family protein